MEEEQAGDTSPPARRTDRTARLLDRLPPALGRPAVLVTVGVVTLLLAGLLGWVTFRDTVGAPEAAPESEPTEVSTERVVSRRGGFSIAAPTELDVRKKRRSLQLVNDDRSLVINVGPGARGRLDAAQREFVDTLDDRYARLRLLATQRTEVNGRRAVTTSGTAVNSEKVPLRFVVMTVRARPQNFTMVVFAPRSSDPATVLPLVNAVANGFRVLNR